MKSQTFILFSHLCHCSFQEPILILLKRPLLDLVSNLVEERRVLPHVVDGEEDPREHLVDGAEVVDVRARVDAARPAPAPRTQHTHTHTVSAGRQHTSASQQFGE